MHLVLLKRPAYIGCMRNISTAPARSASAHSHLHLHVIWQRDAGATVGQGSRRTRLKAGEWLICDAQPQVEADPLCDAHVLQMELPRSLLLTPVRALNALLLKPLPCRGPAHIAAEMLAAAREAGAASEPLEPAMLDALAALIDQALAAESESRGLLSQLGTAAELQRSQLQAYLLERLSDHALSMDRVAEAFGMSRRSLYKLFEAWGTTPRAFVHNAKLDRACALLSQAAEPVSRIARQCGFTDPAHFSRAFQARHGSAPSAWRSRQVC